MPPQPSERALAWLAARGVTAGNKPLGRYNADKAKSDKEYINDDTFDTYPNEYEFFKDKMINGMGLARDEVYIVNSASGTVSVIPSSGWPGSKR